MMKQHSIYMFLGVLLTTTACSDDYFNHNEEVEYSDYIGYNVTVTGNEQFLSRSGGDAPHNSRQLTIENTGETIGGRPLYLHTEVVDSIPMSISQAKNSATPSRGTITTAPANIGISAVVFDGDKNAWPNAEKTAEAQMYMHNEKLTSPWQTNRYWPRENSWIRFYAYSPYNILGENGLPVISTTEPSFSYTVDNDITEQQDLLVGSEQYIGGWCQTAQLDMCHALAAVKIHIDGNVSDFTLKELTIEGLNNSGTYTYKFDSGATSDGKNDTQTHDAGTWTDQSGTAKYTLYHDEIGMPLTTIEKDANNNSLIDPETGKSTGYTDMTAGNMVLLMMPQTLTANAKITITGYDEILKQDGVKLSATIGNGVKQWEKGKMYTYTLSFSSTDIQYHLNVNPETAIPYYGIKDAPITVESYKAVTRSGIATVKIPVPWEAVAVIDGEEKPIPDWFMMQAESGAGSADATTYTYSAVPNLTSSQSHVNMKSLSHKGTAEDPFNLSTNKMYSAGHDPENTANCYYVSAPGYYTFPLVYGNAITGGSTNSSAYKGYEQIYATKTSKLTDANGNLQGSEATATYSSLGNFVDHDDKDITQPWIVSSRGGHYVADKAEIVWQDEPCLITEVKLNETKDYITFRVRQDCICEGNAVIAVKDENGTTMWSWHIWVADGYFYYDIGDSGFDFYNNSTNSFVTRPVKNRMTKTGWEDYDRDTKANNTPTAGTYTETEFKIIPAHLGHCDGETKIYGARSLTLRFKQVEDANAEFLGTPLSQDCTFEQQKGTVTTIDNIPYYQYGRKDPMLPTGNGNDTDKVHYLNNWTQSYTIVNANGQAKTLGEAIQNPEKYYHVPAGTGRTSDLSSNIRLYNWYNDKGSPYINLWNTSSQFLPMFSECGLKAPEYHAKFDEIIRAGVTKTIYDPCPPGFELPRVDAFSGATYSGRNMWPFYYYTTDGTYIQDFHTESGAAPVHLQANVWIPAEDTEYDPSNPISGLNGLIRYNGLTLYCETMDEVGTRGAGQTMEWGGPSLFVPFFGHRNGEYGKVAQYGNYAAALTCTPTCMQWYTTEQENNATGYLFQYMRLCIIKGSCSLRVFSASDFDLAFGIMPAINPSSTISGNANWSGDNSNINVGF